MIRLGGDRHNADRPAPAICTRGERPPQQSTATNEIGGLSTFPGRISWGHRGQAFFRARNCLIPIKIRLRGSDPSWKSRRNANECQKPQYPNRLVGWHQLASHQTWVFCDSKVGATASANLYSLVMSAQKRSCCVRGVAVRLGTGPTAALPQPCQRVGSPRARSPAIGKSTFAVPPDCGFSLS
jgi:hypothetical protein